MNKMNFRGLLFSSSRMAGMLCSCSLRTSRIRRPRWDSSLTTAFTVEDLPVPASPVSRMLAAGLPESRAMVLSRMICCSRL